MTSRIHEQLTKYEDRLGSTEVYVVHHPDAYSSWARAVFNGENYDEGTAYNHRTIRPQEVIIEYDDGDRKTNYDLAMRASRKLSAHNAAHSVWTSGNKSTHIHTFFNFSDAENVRFLKRLLFKFFGTHKHRGKWYEPDMALSSPDHLIRAEFGVHETTQNHKSFVDKTAHFPQYNSIPEEVWEEYDTTDPSMNDFDDEELVESVANSEAFKWLLDPQNVKEIGDGRKRGTFILGNILWQATDRDKEDIINFCQEWYEEAGGRKDRLRTIKNQLESNFELGGYTPGYLYLSDYLSDIGMERLIKE